MSVQPQYPPGAPIVDFRSGYKSHRVFAQWLRKLLQKTGVSVNAPVYGAGVWRDALSMYAIGGAVGYGTVTGSIEAVLLPAATTEDLGFSVVLPNTYRDGQELEPYLLWAPSDATAGNVVWELDYTVASVDGTLAASAQLEVTSAAPEVADQLTRVLLVDGDGDPIGGTGRVKGDLILCRITRKGADAADTYAANAALFGVGFQFPVDGAGEIEAHP